MPFRSKTCVLALLVLAGSTPACKLFCPAPPPPKKYEAPDERYVFFMLGKSDVLPDGYYNIGYVVAQLDASPSMHVLIVGHADQRGRPDANYELSFRRARAVRKVLIEKGIKERRIFVAAPKEQSESTLAQLNRRADLFVYDPLLDAASKRLGYPIDLKTE
jgi:hypothetical protein